MVTFPDAMAVAIAYLNANMTPPVLPRVPSPRPAEFLTVRRTGGPKRNLVTDQAQLTVESWAESDEDAHDNIQRARALLNDMPGQTLSGVPVYRVEELTGPANLPDPLSDQPRYSQSFSVALRGT